VIASRFAIASEFRIDPAAASLVNYFGIIEPVMPSGFTDLERDWFFGGRDIGSVTFESYFCISRCGNSARKNPIEKMGCAKMAASICVVDVNGGADNVLFGPKR
jgi:hypothetical protein